MGVCSAPAQILLHDAMHHSIISGCKSESGSEHNVSAAVENARVISKLMYSRSTVRRPLPREDRCRFEDVGDEHCALACRLRFEKMQVLPDSTANGAGNSNVVLEARPAALNRLWNDLTNDGSSPP